MLRQEVRGRRLLSSLEPLRLKSLGSIVSSGSTIFRLNAVNLSTTISSVFSACDLQESRVLLKLFCNTVFRLVCSQLFRRYYYPTPRERFNSVVLNLFKAAVQYGCDAGVLSQFFNGHIQGAPLVFMFGFSLFSNVTNRLNANRPVTPEPKLEG